MNKCAETLIASHPLSQRRGNVGSMIQVASGKVCLPLLMPLVSCIKAVCLRLPALSLSLHCFNITLMKLDRGGLFCIKQGTGLSKPMSVQLCVRVCVMFMCTHDKRISH